MKKVLALILAVVMVCTLTACGSAKKMEQLCGVWEMTFYQDADTVESLLSSMDFYAEEIELIDLNSMPIVMTVEYREDKTYCYAFDVSATQDGVHAFYAQVIEDLYNGRENLVASYGEDILNMTEDEFAQSYAELFGQSDIATLLNLFVESSLDYDVLYEDIENGTFRIQGNKIYCTVTGTTLEESVSYSISGNTLTLVYADDTEVYTKR